jgi:hypothetical protein
VVIVNADAQATHQAVINVMEAARPGLSRLTFATRAVRSDKTLDARSPGAANGRLAQASGNAHNVCIRPAPP